MLHSSARKPSQETTPSDKKPAGKCCIRVLVIVFPVDLRLPLWVEIPKDILKGFYSPSVIELDGCVVIFKSTRHSVNGNSGEKWGDINTALIPALTDKPRIVSE